jgi:hypothetical protein
VRGSGVGAWLVLQGVWRGVSDRAMSLYVAGACALRGHVSCRGTRELGPELQDRHACARLCTARSPIPLRFATRV